MTGYCLVHDGLLLGCMVGYFMVHDGYRLGCMAGYCVGCTTGNVGNCLVLDLNVVAWVHAGLLLGV